MSIECAICERDARSGHAPECPRNKPRDPRPCAGCGKTLTATEAHYYESLCEPCEADAHAQMVAAFEDDTE